MSIKPMPYYVMVQPSPRDTREDQRPSGLVVFHDPDPAVHVYSGVVLEVGEEFNKDIRDSPVEIGNVLYYLQSVKIGEVEFVVARWDNIVAIERD